MQSFFLCKNAHCYLSLSLSLSLTHSCVGMDEWPAHLNCVKDAARMKGGLVLHVAFLSLNLLLFHSLFHSGPSSTASKISLELASKNINTVFHSLPPFLFSWKKGEKVENIIDGGVVDFCRANPIKKHTLKSCCMDRTLL